MSEAVNDVKEQVLKQYKVAEDFTAVSLRAWNELVTVSTDMAFDVAMKNWDYAKNLRTSSEKAIEDAIRAQRTLSNEMLQVFQGYYNGMQDIVGKTIR
jgi:hypothetical protein